MKLFLTGATGLLGRNMVPLLLERGHEIIAMVRKPDSSRKAFSTDSNLTFVEGDLDQIEKVAPHLSGVDAIVHAAALFTDYYNHSATWEQFEKLNVEATVTLFQLGKKAGVKKAIFVSSVGALADPNDGLQDEHLLKDLYRRSKVAGERRLRNENSLQDFPIITLRPGWIYGPEDPAPTSTGRMVQELIEKGKTAMVIGAPIPMVDARDVALAIALALEKSDRTTAYNIAGAQIPAIQALNLLASHIPGSKVEGAPLWLATIMGTALEWKAKLFGGINPMPIEGLKFVALPLPVNTDRSIKELGMTYRPFEETARDVATYWLKRCGKS